MGYIALEHEGENLHWHVRLALQTLAGFLLSRTSENARLASVLLRSFQHRRTKQFFLSLAGQFFI
jgi:hypothetical protein